MSDELKGREYRYQRDWSVGAQMFHVRCDDWEEFVKAVKNMQEMIPATKSFPEDEGPKAQRVPDEIHQCPVHGNTTKWLTGVAKKTGKEYAFWGCSAKNADGSFCREKIT